MGVTAFGRTCWLCLDLSISRLRLGSDILPYSEDDAADAADVAPQRTALAKSLTFAEYICSLSVSSLHGSYPAPQRV